MDIQTRAEIVAAIEAKYEEAKREEYLPDQVMVSAEESALEVMEGLGYKVLQPLGGTSYHLVRLPEGRAVESAVEELSALQGVSDVELDVVPKLCQLPNDPYLFHDLVVDTGTYPSQMRLMTHIDVADYWGRLARYPGPIVQNRIAVIDAGVYLGHEDLAGQLDLPGYNVTDGSDNVSPPSQVTSNLSYHGTTTAGIIGAAVNNEKGIAGLGVYSKVYPVRIFTDTGSWSMSNVISGINHAVGKGIRILSLSFAVSHSTALEQACKSAQETGRIIVASAGNGASSIIGYPSKYASAISVAGLAPESLEVHPDSDYGDGVDFCVPYNAISTYPDGAMDISGDYKYVSGTSYAAPAVAALAGTLLAINPALTWDSVYDIMRRSCIPETPRGDTRYGNGIPQFTKAVQFAIDSVARSGFYSSEGYIGGLYVGDENGLPMRIGAAHIGNKDGTPRKIWAATM